VPAVMGYNWLVRRNKGGMERIRAFSSDLHSVLLSGARVGEQLPQLQTPLSTALCGRSKSWR